MNFQNSYRTSCRPQLVRLPVSGRGDSDRAEKCFDFAPKQCVN